MPHVCDLVDIETWGSGTDNATLTNRAVSTNNSHCVCGHIASLVVGEVILNYCIWLPDRAGYHGNPGFNISRYGPYIGSHLAFYFKLNVKQVYNVL